MGAHSTVQNIGPKLQTSSKEEGKALLELSENQPMWIDSLDNRYQDRYLTQPPHLVPTLLKQLLENSEGTELTYRLEVILNTPNQLTHLANPRRTTHLQTVTAIHPPDRL